MTQSCPITPEVVDDHVTRVGAALTILIVIAAIGLGRFWIPLLLALDFGLRSRGWSAFSPLARLSQSLRQAFGLQPRPINAGPKRFAALIGLIFALGIAIAQALHHPTAALALGSVLIFCAAMEAFLGFCLGCKVYSFLLSSRFKHSPSLGVTGAPVRSNPPAEPERNLHRRIC